MLQQRGIKMKNLGFTIPIDQDVDAIMTQDCKQSTMIAKRTMWNGQLKPLVDIGLNLRQQIKNTDGTYKLEAIDQLPPIRIKMNTIINNMYILDSNKQSYLNNPSVNALKQSAFNSFIDPQEQYFELINSTNSNAICFNNVDTDLAIAYRCIGLMRVYEPTGNNFITSIEPLQGADQSYFNNIRYNYGKQITLTNGNIIETDTNPINVQSLTMQQISNSINTYPIRMICSLPALT
ncbi:MAG: hypothetical protein EZS28_050353, partial [Streblomastix strix]